MDSRAETTGEVTESRPVSREEPFAPAGRGSLASGRWPTVAMPARCRQATRAFVAFAIGGSVGEEPAKLANVPGTRRYAPTQVRRSKTDCSTNGSPLDMCRQMAPPQKALLSKSPSEEVRGMSSRTALASSPAPMTPIGRLKPIFATWSGGKSPKTFAEPARIMMPPINPCSTQPAMVFQCRFAFMVQSPSVCGSVLHDSYLNHVAKKTVQITPEDRQAHARHLQARALAKGGPGRSSSVPHSPI